MKKHQVVITGIGLISAQGIGIHYFNNNTSGRPLIGKKSDWQNEDIGEQYYYQIPDFDIKSYFDNLRAPYPLRYSQLAMLGCLDAMKDAGLNEFAYDKSRTGILIDTSFGASEAVEEYLDKLFKDGPRKVRPFKFSQTVSNVCLGYTARQFELRGPSSLLFGENSVCYGFDLIQNGEADVMICGGVDSIRDYVFGLHHDADALIKPSASTTEGHSEFYLQDLAQQQDKKRVTVGEASAFVILENKAHAEQRQADIYAELLDYAVVQDDAYETFIFERSPEDTALSMQEALNRSGTACTDVDVVVGEASSPKMFAEVDQAAINELWGDHSLYYTSMKPHIGETFSSSAQASVGLAASILRNQHGLDNPIADQYPQQDNISLQSTEDRELRTAIVNTGQLGGNNTSFVLKKI